jgi:2-polyprenyl-3-methyl-5-hydroxy-6-metoxy-1,4-benzoquinol methylase
MERAEWLKEMRSKAEVLYDQISPLYWETFGLEDNETHCTYLKKFLKHVTPGGVLLSAACGAGRFDGMLMDAGRPVIGIDQSAGMLRRAREHFPQERYPQLRYEKMSLQEMEMKLAYHEAFDGIICMDAMEHICPEDYPEILHGFHQALKPGCLLYFTADTTETAIDDGVDIEGVYERAKKLGFPVVRGEWVDEIEVAYKQTIEIIPGQQVPENLADRAVYHYYPPVEQVRAWIDQADLVIEDEGLGSGWYHFITMNKNK